MSNRNDNNRDELDRSSDEEEQNLAINNSIYIVIMVVIFPEQPTPLSQPVADERPTNPQDLTNEQIDLLIVRQPDGLEPTIPARYWLIFMLFDFIVYQCWPLFIFVRLAYQLLTNNNQRDVNLRESQSLYSNLISHSTFDPNRDAQREGRTAHPTEEDITFSETVEIPDHVPFGIPNTQAHDIAMLVNLNDNQHTEIMTNNENGNMNNGEMIVPNIQNEAIVPITANENDVPHTAVDDPTYNINPLGSIESRDDAHSSDSSDEEDRIVNSGSGFEGDDEDESSDDNEQTGRTSPIIENPPNSVQNNPPSNQTNVLDEQPATIVPLHNEAVDIEANVANPAEGARQVIIPVTPSTGILNPKPTNRVRPNVQSDDIHSA